MLFESIFYYFIYDQDMNLSPLRGSAKKNVKRRPVKGALEGSSIQCAILCDDDEPSWCPTWYSINLVFSLTFFFGNWFRSVSWMLDITTKSTETVEVSENNFYCRGRRAANESVFHCSQAIDKIELCAIESSSPSYFHFFFPSFFFSVVIRFYIFIFLRFRNRSSDPIEIVKFISSCCSDDAFRSRIIMQINHRTNNIEPFRNEP